MVVVNDFAPAVINKTFSMNDIISGIKHGVFKWSDFKPEIRQAVQDELDHRQAAKAKT